MASGSCACKHIRYTTSASPTRLVNCHCSECRKQAGAPYLSFVHVPAGSIQWETEPKEWKSSENATRTFCPRCGSVLTMKVFSMPEEEGLAAGTLDDVKGLVPSLSAHIFLKEKASWFQVPDDGAERYEGWPQ
ncbi:hypothetical protein N7532_006842 [Penicillium argentinense]|uniref:CENP-V/GFA domain-containing protein n=1 Tax=Penicillium argentinense TaxID=1131581 RepID=A0A9W9KBN4_9EURO|nr:uncharacterized protein N7532_006842 [Penicillium argentinense]KAJ5099841.1 hypothetical protein N7532_006842 [Penicillium argentinense]